MLGEAKIEQNGLTFNMTPSPGATSSLAIALTDAEAICKKLGIEFDHKKHKLELQTAHGKSSLKESA